jgi:TPR repeat protein
MASAGAALKLEEFDEASSSADCDELYQLGLAYSTGRGVQPDYVVAHKWFNLAAMRGSREARDYRAELATQMSGAEIAQAQRLAREWLNRHGW